VGQTARNLPKLAREDRLRATNASRTIACRSKGKLTENKEGGRVEGKPKKAKETEKQKPGSGGPVKKQSGGCWGEWQGTRKAKGRKGRVHGRRQDLQKQSKKDKRGTKGKVG